MNPNINSDDKWSKVYFLGGKPYLGDKSVTQKSKEVSSNRINCARQKSYDKGYTKEHGKKTVLKKVSVFIDGENISARYVEEIIEKTSKKFEIQKMKCYIRKNDESTVHWSEEEKERDLKVVPIPGQPKKDKIDNIIKHDIRQIIDSNKANAICIVTSDGGYVDIVNEIKSSGKEAVIVGEEKTPERLRKAATRFIKLSRR